jgi:hypothetical protein
MHRRKHICGIAIGSLFLPTLIYFNILNKLFRKLLENCASSLKNRYCVITGGELMCKLKNCTKKITAKKSPVKVL